MRDVLAAKLQVLQLDEVFTRTNTFGHDDLSRTDVETAFSEVSKREIVDELILKNQLSFDKKFEK